ncbi:MAG: outer membrane protein assembly factor BamA, partial [Planctomycetota bacterium]|nr:outer membrane protein assembly factor BamA [Planctomycetota bacterium]MDI6788317.1 outer membrane protein assembly factor BamA [Planctomycetota bacterium]
EEKEPVIDSIEIIGLNDVNLQTVLNKIQSKKDGYFSATILEDDIRRLYESNLFLKIDWKIEKIEEGKKVKIIITVEESAPIQEVKFSGARSLGEFVLKETIKMKAEDSLNNSLIKSDIKEIIERYLAKGYYFVDVTHQVEDGPKGKILSYIIREGPQVKIKDVIFSGNRAFPLYRTWLFWSTSFLHKAMVQTSGHYNERELMLDIERLKKFYRDKGWLDVNLFVEDITFNDKKNKVTITIHIDEGEQYKVGNFNVSDNKVIRTEDILSKMKLKEDTVYATESILKDINTIKTLYGKLGYIDCNVEIKTHFPAKPATVDLTYQIIESQPSYLEKIKIAGNDKTKDKVIRREMIIYPGDLMDYGLINTSLERIARTQYFKGLDYEIEDTGKPGRKNIVLKLSETTTGMMNFGGGYSSNYGFSGIIEYSQMNFDLANLPKSFGGFFTGKSFAGGGQTLKISWQPGIQASRYGIFFTEPYVFDKPFSFEMNISGFERSWASYTEERDSVGFSISRRFWNTCRIGMGPQKEQIEISDVKSTAPQTIQELSGDKTLQTVMGFIEQDTRDRWYFPRKGYRIRLSEEYTGGVLGGDFDFTKTFLTVENFNPLLDISDDKKIVLGLTTTIAQIETMGDTEKVPFFERFYAGGFRSIRGFRFRSISPKENGVSVGGKILSLFNSELTCPLYTEDIGPTKMEIVRLAVFYDAGNAVNGWDELKWDKSRTFTGYDTIIRTSFGYGLRFQIGPIPLSWDIAYPIKKLPDDDIQRVQMNFGFGF